MRKKPTPCNDLVHGEALKFVPNDGYLSPSHGFLCPTVPMDRLPSSHVAWDDTVRKVPHLFYTQDTQRLFEQLPVLSSNRDELPDEALPRAATVLSILASAYWRHGLDRAFAVRTELANGTLPDSILQPWTMVNQRLGRGPRPFQSLYDLFFNNFRLRSGGVPGETFNLSDVRIDNLDVATPSFGNEPERIFYMSFVEIHAIGATIINGICAIENLLALESAESDSAIVGALETIERSLRQCTDTLKKIQPVRSKSTYCDPVLWAKTVAVFAVPPSNFVQGGASGTSAPILFIMDALLSRDRYGTYYGKYVRDEASLLLPALHREFARCIRLLPLKGHILSRKTTAPARFEELARAYNLVVDGYAGAGGFLDRHVSKVFNYLGVATMVGRNQSTSGHTRHVHAETWDQVARELRVSLAERAGLLPCPHQISKVEVEPPSATNRMPTYRPSEVARHHKKSDAWVIIDNLVVNVTSFIERHPGGSAIIRGYLGRNATGPFSMVSAHGSAAVKRMLQPFVIGSIPVQSESDLAVCSDDQKGMSTLLETLLRVFGLLDLQYDHETTKPLQTLFRFQAYFHFWTEHLVHCIEHINGLSPSGLSMPLLCGSSPTWTAEMRAANWLDEEELDRLGFPHLAEVHLKRSINLIEELIDITINALEQSTDTAIAQGRLRSAIERWAEDHTA